MLFLRKGTRLRKVLKETHIVEMFEIMITNKPAHHSIAVFIYGVYFNFLLQNIFFYKIPITIFKIKCLFISSRFIMIIFIYMSMTFYRNDFSLNIYKVFYLLSIRDIIYNFNHIDRI